jgi:hypothetical protein
MTTVTVQDAPAAEPLLSNPMLVGTTFSVSVATVACRTYFLESKNDWLDVWTVVTQVLGDGSVKVLEDTNATGFSRFYRVRVVHD